MRNKHTIGHDPSSLQSNSRIQPLIFLWTPKGFISPEYFLNFFSNLYIPPWSRNTGPSTKRRERWARGPYPSLPHTHTLFLKSYFARDAFTWKFAFVLFSMASKTFLAPALPESCRGPWKNIKFMVLRLLEGTFVSHKIEYFHSYSFP